MQGLQQASLSKLFKSADTNRQLAVRWTCACLWRMLHENTGRQFRKFIISTSIPSAFCSARVAISLRSFEKSPDQPNKGEDPKRNGRWGAFRCGEDGFLGFKALRLRRWLLLFMFLRVKVLNIEYTKGNKESFVIWLRDASGAHRTLWFKIALKLILLSIDMLGQTKRIYI